MNEIPIPRRVEWSGPNFWTVWADEDGVHVRSRSGDGLEQVEVKALFDLWTAARKARDEGTIPAPRIDLPF